MSGDSDWVVDSPSLILPFGAGPLDNQIILDPNPSGCLATRYAAVIVFRQNSPVFRGQFFIGVVRSDIGALPNAGETWIERGFMLNDPTDDSGTGVCWIYVTGRWRSSMGVANVFQMENLGNLLTINGPAVNQTFILDVEGDMSVWGNITWGQAITGSKQDRQVTSYTSTSTAYTTAGQPAFCAVIFIAPPSGNMLFTFGGNKNNNTAGTPSNFLALTIKTGNSIGSGTTFLAASDDVADTSANTSATFNGCNSYLATGLTVGALYNAYLQHRVQTGTGTFQRRFITAVPVF